MIRGINANDSRFKSVTFRPGFNILVADKTKDSSDTDSRNGVGKSSIIEILHFGLGMRSLTDSVLADETLANMEFTLEMDWPDHPKPVQISRSIKRRSKVKLWDFQNSRGEYESVRELSIPDWVDKIGEDLFRLPQEHEGISARSLLSYFIRRDSQDAFNDAVKTYSAQSMAEAGAHLAFLLGLDWRLAVEYQKLVKYDALRKKLKEATKDPAFGLVVGTVSELRGLLTASTQNVMVLEEEVREFRVVPEYEKLQARADEIDEWIRTSRVQDVADRRNLHDIESALRSELEPDISYLDRVYADLEIQLPEVVRRRYDEVRTFHNSVVANRKKYLEEELQSTRNRLNSREDSRLKFGDEQSRLLKALSGGGALHSLSVLQDQLSIARAKAQGLKIRFEAAKSLEASQAEIKYERSRIQQTTSRDLVEREAMLGEINLLFLRFASTLYSPDREAFIDISPEEKYLRVAPHIGGENSQGIGNMVIFCFDLTLAVLAHRAGRGPDFLVHDSRLFDGVDQRQVSKAFDLAVAVTKEESMQYIVTLNSDDLDKVNNRGSRFDQFIVEPRLTDEYENGGLFGFHFE